MKNKRRILFTIIMIIAFILLGYCGYMIYQSYYEYKQVDDTYDEIVDEVINENDKPTEQKEIERFSVNWNKLLNINSDVIAWIRIPNTNINYPIVKGSNNNQYLHHNIYGKYSKGGCPFVDSATITPFSNLNTIIYGHNLDNGSMFSNVKKYKNRDYAKEHNIIEIYLPDKTVNKYYVFAFGEVDANDYDVYNVYVDDLNKYYETTKKYNTLEVEQNYDTTKPIITLSTCTNRNENKRYVLQAYLVE